jgi:hypothetical protein
VREESHLEAMRSAIRGDFERLAERRGDQELLRVPDDEPREPEEEAAPEVAVEDEPRRSWFSRFVSP